MKSQEVVECKHGNATVRIHLPARSKEDIDETVKKATETFMRKVEMKRKRMKTA